MVAQECNCKKSSCWKNLKLGHESHAKIPKLRSSPLTILLLKPSHADTQASVGAKDSGKGESTGSKTFVVPASLIVILVAVLP